MINPLDKPKIVFSLALISVLAAVGRAISAAIANPLIPLIKLPVLDLMAVRGGLAMICIAIFMVLTGRRIVLPGKYVWLFAILFAINNLAFYSAIQAWGVNSTSVLFTLTPLVSIVAKLWRKERVKVSVYWSLFFLVFGVAVALNPWQTAFSFSGLFWSLISALFMGLSFEVLGKTKEVDPYNRTFFLSVVVVIFGCVVSFLQGHVPLTHYRFDTYHIALLLTFGVMGGFVWSVCTIKVFDHLSREVASVLSMGQTPAVIIGAWLILGERLSFIQWFGVGIALGAAGVLSVMEARAKPVVPASTPLVVAATNE